MKKTAKELETEALINQMIEKYSKEEVLGFLENLLMLNEAERKAVLEIAKMVDRVEKRNIENERTTIKVSKN